jgi:3-deoxy-D-manno-octulosonate 8-phosphate phosphatase (KDO 8-P phosphatase)
MMRLPSTEELKQIRLLLLDVDGVLTDGGIIYSDNGSEIKIFNARDGLGLRLLMEAGVETGIVTGRKSKALHHRCRDIGIQYLFDGVRNKVEMLARIVEQTGISGIHTAYMGDDLPDLPLMRAVGLSIAVADAHRNVREKADWITSAAGGRGAVREVCEALLTARGVWDELTAHF